ncbi:cytidine deaminase [[Mycoplasma] gypis]|uniref:Cytidine deaminase n=1 Tax=[Mycoplasma] gypis TaxID=92404 RepID=A0ABZ2RV73_9BACT|nr:cytidine deaminase [[Mycoplasma] gypis]MBN0919294.1 cytidine deaminase [[Mycoplasma] gypis]
MKVNIKKLKDNLNFSYAPYSKFKVSALAIDSQGREFYGVNCENIAYPSGLCAERSALFSSVVHGAEVGTFKEIHIIATSEEPIYPCAGCIQVMCQFMQPDSKVYCYSNDAKIVNEHKLKELIPYGLWPTSIKVG